MKSRIAQIVFVGVSVSSLTLMAQAVSAGASSWSAYSSQCTKWLNDIPKLDSYIIQDNKVGNVTALSLAMLALSADGRHIEACNNSPDSALNAVAAAWGKSLIVAGGYGFAWANHQSASNLSMFLSKEGVAKSFENQYLNRLAALGR